MKRSPLLLSVVTLIALSAFSAPQAQEAPKPDLLRQYLSETDAARKGELRTKLTSLGGPALREAIAKLAYPKAGQTGALEFETLCPDGFKRPYYMHVPPKYDEARRYPLIIWLHGGVSGAPAEAASGAIEMWQQALGDDWSEEVMVLAPAAIAADTTEDARWWRDKGQLNVLHMLKEVKLAFNVDDERVFVTGMSDGGSGAFALAARRPDAFSGFIPMVGHPLVPSFDGTCMFWENLSKVRIYAISGGKDRLYPAAQVAQVVAEANQNGASIEHKIYEEAGHDLSYAPKEIPRILEDMVGKWRRDMALASLDWSTDSPAMGRRAWLEITELADLGDLNAKDLKATPRSGQARVVLGITMNPELDVTDPVVVDSVAKDSVAEAMGIKAGDVIVGLDKAKIGNLNDLRAALARKKAGDDVEVEIERDGKSQTLKGKFPQAKSSSGQLMARIKASTRTVKGERGMERHFELLAANAGKLTLFLTADDVAAGRLSVSINGKAMTFDGLAHDAAFILSEFERTGDRKLPYVARLHIDVAVALKGAK